MSVSTYTPDSTKILHTAYADFVSRQIGRTIHVVQYDDSLPLLAVKLFSDGQPYTIPSNAEISIKLGKSDGKFVYNPALGCDSARHTAYFEITYQMVVLAETVSPIIEVRIGSSIAASSSIGIIIDRNPIQREDIESTSEWKVIEQAIDYSKEAVSAAASASASRSAAAASESNALAYRNAAQTAATNAANSASAASASATKAKTSETNAANSASASATSAAKSKESENNAKTSETNAKTSETNAKTSETNAANSERKAGEKASEADVYSIMSKSYAIGEGGIRSNEKTDNAKYYSEQAANSSNDAKESAYNSDMHSMLAKSYAVGESTVTLGDGVDELVTDDGFTIELFGREGEDTDNAKYYSEQAANSASSIFGVEERVSADLDEWSEKLTEMQTLAEQVSENKESVEASERNAKVSENNAKTSETNAKTSETNAKTSETNAKTSETNAKTSEENAKASEDNIADCEEACVLNAKISRSYAVGDTDYRAGENVDNAKYYYQQVKQISEGLGGLIPMGTIPFASLSLQTKVPGYMFNISDSFESDNTFKDGGNIKYPAGTNVYLTADGYWDCLAGSLIFGIKGNAESDYRYGFVNITPENIGSYDKESVDNLVSGLNNIIQSLSGTVNILTSRIMELEDLSGFAHLVVDGDGSELVTSDNQTIILSV
ncbi:MAG: hypothetical protein NC347_04095 [Clostridium sp.]|nr:hypothetical protein [Clostridium sp.]